jgi:hypothetical protein
MAVFPSSLLVKIKENESLWVRIKKKKMDTVDHESFRENSYLKETQTKQTD